jgi:hypothetical protein
MSEQGELDVELSGERYVLRREGDDLRVGRRVGGDVTWLESVGLETLPEQARTAVERGDAHDEALTIALRGVVQAEVERGG